MKRKSMIGTLPKYGVWMVYFSRSSLAGIYLQSPYVTSAHKALYHLNQDVEQHIKLHEGNIENYRTVTLHL